MITELNDYLSVSVSPEQRAQLLEVARVLESVVGENVYVAIDEILEAPEKDDIHSTVDSLYEALLGTMETVLAKYGIFLDEDVLETRHLFDLSRVLEAVTQLELNEAKDYIGNLIDAADDAQGALLDILDEVAPGTSMVLEETILRVDYNLIYKLRELLREPNPRVELEAFDEDASRHYVERCQSFRKKFGRTPLVGALLDHGAKLRYDPAVTVALISGDLETEDAKGSALELYALVTYSNVPSHELVPTTKRLIEQVCVDPAHVMKLVDAFHEIMGA